ncbi:MAG: putative capsular polysaccharide synthesis family protein [Elusimicrobiota bacterium]
MKKNTVIDIYRYMFPKEKGYQTIKEGSYELLILKIEILDESIEKAIIGFLDLDDDFKLQ